MKNKITIAIILLLGSAILAILWGVNDPITLPIPDGAAIISKTIASNSYSQIKTIEIPKNNSTISIKATALQRDFDLSLAMGQSTFVINPAGYAGFPPEIPYASFPHVDHQMNEIVFVFDGQTLNEIWINRERFWLGEIAVDKTLELSAEAFEQPVQVELVIIR